MNRIDDRRWWPFAIDANSEQQSTEVKVKLQFLTEADRCGCRAFVQHNEFECGAIGDDGRECLIIWRGKQRAEIILWQNDEVRLKKLFFSMVESEAFDAAASLGLRWLNDGE